MTKKNPYQQPMQAWPSLAPYGKQSNIEFNGLSLFYFEAGAEHDQTILFVHGLGDEADTWRHVFLHLAESFHVIAPDLPGFGRSTQAHCENTPPCLIGALISLMDQLSIDRAIFIGSSLGGILSHAIGLQHPARVAGLILVGGSLVQLAPMQDRGLKLMRLPLLGEWLYTRLRKDPQAAFDSLRNVYYNLDALPKIDRDFLFKRVNKRVWSDRQRKAYFSTLRNLTPWLDKQQKDLVNRLIDLTVPTLVIRGEHDPLFAEDNADAIVALQPSATKAIIAGSGHLPHQEDPECFLKSVIEWLNRNFDNGA